MSLARGTRIGPYELLAPIGEGGMGEVYRAKDARLGRDVAVKILPPSFSDSPDRLRRLEQEARATSALNHPNVVVVHDTGQHEGSPYIVYELLEGGTLRQLLTSTPLSTSRVIGYAIEIARGLAAAHDRGIVHRDLKPENVFITLDERVKVLDFGIARVVESAVPTLDTLTRQPTEAGVVIGTVGYMSPEQVRGERVDQRSDIFNVGMVLYEMLAGRRAFSGASTIETLNAILNEDPPDLSGGGGGEMLPALERIVRHCLEKNPDLRFQSSRDVAFALEGLGTRFGASHRPVAPQSRTGWSSAGTRVAWILATLGLVSSAILGTLYARREVSTARIVQFEVPAPAHGAFQGILGVSSMISPDGETLAMAVTTDSGPRLFVRSLASMATRPLDGTEGASSPFWSPDSRWLGFFAEGKMKRVALGGGAPQTICDVPSRQGRLASWGRDDTILFTGYQDQGVYRVAAGGGQPGLVITPGRGALFTWPSFLPDGRHFLFYALDAPKPAEVRVGSLDSTETKVVLQGYSRAVYAEPGYLLFVREGTLMAQAFDLASLSVSGRSIPVAEDLLYFRDLGQSDFSVSTNGVLAYQAGNTDSRLVWFLRDGTETTQIGEAGDYWFPRLSPNGQKVATDVMDRHAGTTDIQIFDLARGGGASSVTRDGTIDWTPVFSPDGQQLAFASARAGAPHVHSKRLNDSGPGEQLVPPSGSLQLVTDWVDSPNGSFIIYLEGFQKTGIDLMRLPLSGSRRPFPIVQTPGDDTDGRVSPDGKWLAYVSTESGRSEVYVRPVDGPSERWPVSTGGGVSPRWRRNGRELFYLATISALPLGAIVTDGRLMAVDVTATAGRLDTGIPKPLFSVRPRGGQYDVAADGQRFLVNTGGGPSALPITVSLNWTQGLRR